MDISTHSQKSALGKFMIISEKNSTKSFTVSYCYVQQQKQIHVHVAMGNTHFECSLVFQQFPPILQPKF